MSIRNRLVPSKIENQLKAYGAAALAAGVGLLAPKAEAEIVYTPADVVFTNSRRDFDINRDGINDFRITDYAGSYTFVMVYGRGANQIESSAHGRALPVNAGETIGSSDHFRGNATMTLAYAGSGGEGWGKNRYLGLRLQINGETHYGWAKVSIIDRNHKLTVGIQGYAYETTPNKPIVAGRMQRSAEGEQPASVREKSSVTLGLLALGSTGLAAWR